MPSVWLLFTLQVTFIHAMRGGLGRHEFNLLSVTVLGFDSTIHCGWDENAPTLYHIVVHACSENCFSVSQAVK